MAFGHVNNMRPNAIAQSAPSRAALDPVKFIFGGRAVFTLTSTRTGTSFTYRVSAPKEQTTAEPIFFAAVLTGPDNTADYTYAGLASKSGLRATKGSKIGPEAPSFRALDWFLRHADSPLVKFRHEGRCCRCGRPLTTPESIDAGIGPDCAGR